MEEVKRKQLLADFISKDINDIKSLIRGLSEAEIGYAANGLRTIPSSATGVPPLRHFLLIDLFELCEELGVEGAIDDLDSKGKLLNQFPSLVELVPEVASKGSQSLDQKALGDTFTRLLKALEGEVAAAEEPNLNHPPFAFIQQYLECPRDDLTRFLEEQRDLPIREVLAWIGLVKVLVSGIQELEGFVRRRRVLLRDFLSGDRAGALGDYYDLKFVPVSALDDENDPIMDNASELMDGGRLIGNEFSLMMRSVATARSIIQSINVTSLVLDQDVLAFGILRELVPETQLNSFIEFIAQLRTALGKSTADSERYNSVLSLLCGYSLDIERQPDATMTAEGEPTSRLWCELPKQIPLVELAESVVDPTSDQISLDPRSLEFNTTDGLLRLPLLIAYKLYEFHRIGCFQTLLLRECSSVGPVMYKYIMYVFRDGERKPCLALAAETNAAILEEARKANQLAPEGYVAELPLFFGIFKPGAHSNLGLSVDWSSIDKFRSKAHGFVLDFFHLSERPIVVEINAQLEMINSELDRSYRAIREHKYEPALVSVLSVHRRLERCAYRNPLTRSLLYLTWCATELGRLAAAKNYAQSGFVLEELRDNANSASVYLFELSKLRYVDGDLEEALRLCRKAIKGKLATEAWHQQGLTLYATPFNDDIDGELLLLARIQRERGDVANSVETLEMLRTRCEGSYSAELLGDCLDELATSRRLTGEFLSATRCLVDAVSLKLRASDQVGVNLSLLRLFAMFRETSQTENADLAAYIRKARGLA